MFDIIDTRHRNDVVLVDKRLWDDHAKRGDAPDFVEVGEAGIAVGDAMRRGRCVQLVG
jgi:hypothetical protein